MPSNRNNGKRKPRKPLDTEVSIELEEFEYNFCKYVDTAMPRKFRDTYVKQILSALGEAAKCTLKGLRYDAAFFALEKKFQKEKGLTLHPKKVYLQHYSKGVEMLGYKLRFNRMLPSDRISHNFKWKTQCTLQKAAASVAYRYGNAEHFMQTVNSYLGLLGWCNAYRLRRDVVETIKQSVYGDFYDFTEDYTKITLKTPYKRVMHFKRMNFDRKHKIKTQSWLKL